MTAIDADTLTRRFEVAVGAGPRSLARAADGTIWVACEKGDRMDILVAGRKLGLRDALRGRRAEALGHRDPRGDQ